ncbi:Outer membrane phospholipase A [Alteromonadaceae bacterium Bs31]|nr:Outer membrane phospholipase A [Alteromonadaceae bacterium Bs31]
MRLQGLVLGFIAWISLPLAAQEDEAQEVDAQAQQSVPAQQETAVDQSREAQLKESLVTSRSDQNFSLFKLNYAILNDEDLLLQYSFKYRVFEELYLAYTNLILWDIYHEEMPAEDNNFMPEAFYRFIMDDVSWLASIDAGWFHRSNGSAGPTSRAWDRWQLRFNKQFGWKDRSILWTTTFYSDLKKSSKNEDINEYHGPWDTNIVLLNVFNSNRHQLDLMATLESGENGTSFDTGFVRLGAHYRLPFKKFRPTIYAQYWNGYGELIKFYNVKTESFRMGLSFHY